jgi:hypothetical protein
VDIDGDGIGDTPYVLTLTYTDYQLGKEVTLEQGKDYYPLMHPFDIKKDGIAFPSPEPSPSPDPQSQPESFSTALVASISTLMIVGVIAGFIYYQKRRSKV